MYTDFHSHFLPGIDDGAKDPKQSVEILRYLKSQGIETVCATPHYAKHDEEVARFLERRSASYERLKEYIAENSFNRLDFPEIVLGAEVRLYRELSERRDLRELCYRGTDYILLELPFRKFEGWELEEVYNIMYQHNVKPVMAHINRYAELYSKSDYKNMFYNGDFVLQFNTECACSLTGTSLMKKTIKGGYSVVFGCDIHDPAKLHESELDKALKFIEKLDPRSSSDLAAVEKRLIGE